MCVAVDADVMALETGDVSLQSTRTDNRLQREGTSVSYLLGLFVT